MPLNNIDRGHAVNTVRFDIQHLLESVAGYKGLPFPAAILGRANRKTGIATGPKYDVQGQKTTQAYADNGAKLRQYDMLGNYYFMPVVFEADGKAYEIDCALVSVSLKKTIVETPVVGRRGTVKELINTQDLTISITGCLISEEKGYWPESRINDMWALFQKNEAVTLKCALTDCFFDDDDKVVITDLSFPAPNQVEDVVPLSMQCVSDQVFELKID